MVLLVDTLSVLHLKSLGVLCLRGHSKQEHCNDVVVESHLR